MFCVSTSALACKRFKGRHDTDLSALLRNSSQRAQRYDCSVDDRPLPPGTPDESTVLLLAQVGTQAAYRFAQELRELGLLPSRAGILKALGTSAGISRRALGRRLSILPNHVHRLVDELEEGGLVECRGMPGDLRAHALRLTARGEQALASIHRSARSRISATPFDWCRPAEGSSPRDWPPRGLAGHCRKRVSKQTSIAG